MLFFLAFLILSPPSLLSLESADEKYLKLNQVLFEFYNHFESLEKNAEAKKSAEKLLEQYPDDPYFYDLWASIEWTLIGHELNLKIDEQAKISHLPNYAERAAKYYALVEKGLSLTESAEGQIKAKTLLARANLFFDRAKFTARFGNGLSDLSRADKDSAEAIKTLKNLLAEDQSFCPAYFLMGAVRYGLTAKTENSLTYQFFVWLKSKTYAEFYQTDKNVLDKTRALEWLEKSYQCENPELWLKKNWIESAIFLAGSYENYKKDLKIAKELELMETKEMPLLENLISLFPENKGLKEKLDLVNLRVRILKNYLFPKR